MNKAVHGVLCVILYMAVLSLQNTCCCVARQDDHHQLHPIILVPGSGGNQLEARLTDAYKPSSLFCRLCHRHGRWFRLWFDPTVFVPPLTSCFADRMTLVYDAAVDDYHNWPGVETRVPHFGSLQSLLYLVPHLKHISSYMASLVDTLKQMGYTEAQNLYGAPYDFRYGLAGLGHPSKVGSQYLQDLKNLIERASSSNGGKPVILMAHSLGGLYVLHLLNRSPPSWRRAYVKHFIALSSPWAGTVQMMLTFGSGYTLGLPIVDPLAIRAEQRSSESNLWLLPSPRVFGNRTLVTTAGGGEYAAVDMARFLEDIGFGEGVGPYEERIRPLLEGVGPVGVPVTCVVGAGVETPERLEYGPGGFDVQPEIVHGDGDGTVNMVSLLALEREWAGVKGQSVRVIKVNGVSHTSILSDEVALKEIVSVVSRINSVDVVESLKFKIK
ncbi:Lecithin-cholesterol acyltransferase-like 1 [Acorus gramineus]|uniref:Lecithin-cholesterol acyltransferase-like 1 n=1 Tax=Acorus gramineus TaxID=55184 RepID=A0AAV9BKD9_ACOGR|nr:Lecithin-cholesterol acyltransferase-like 1 [Acorus gramineus]